MHSIAECCTVDWGEARRAASYLLKSVYRIDIRKALNPLDDADFLIIVQQLSDQLHAIVGPVEKAAVSKAIASLDVDLTSLTGPELAKIANAANLAMRDIPARVLPELSSTLRVDMTDTVGATKVRVASNHKWSIPTSLDAVDKEMISAMSGISSWVTDEYGKRASMIELGIQQAIADGMSKGLRSESIAENISRMANGQINQSPKYWNIVATNLSNRARGYGNLRSMNQAGVESCMFYAVMDERTSLECRALHETVFQVQSSLGLYDELKVQSQGDFSAVERVMPFVKRRLDANGNTELYVQPPGQPATVIGTAVGSAVGRADVRGTFLNMMTPAQLTAAGVAVPPIHNACRSTLVPVI